MFRPFRVLAGTFAFAASCSFAGAQPNVLGVWKGKIIVNASKLSGGTDPKVAAMLKAQIAAVAKLKIGLSLAANHTFVMKVSGSPVAAQNKTRAGTWSLKGNQLTLLDAANFIRPNPFTIAKDGKSFVLSLPNGVESLKYTR